MEKLRNMFMKMYRLEDNRCLFNQYFLHIEYVSFAKI